MPIIRLKNARQILQQRPGAPPVGQLGARRAPSVAPQYAQQAPQAPQAQQKAALGPSAPNVNPGVNPGALAIRPPQTPPSIAGRGNGQMVRRDAHGQVVEGANRGDPTKPPNAGDYGNDPRAPGYVDPNETTQEKIDRLVREALDNADNVDTSAQEALIQQQIKDKLGASLWNQNASAGASGFGESGALMAQQGDTMRQANQDAVEQILGARQKAEQDAYERAQGWTATDQKERDMAHQAELDKAQMDAFNAWLETQGGAPVDTGGLAGDLPPFSVVGHGKPGEVSLVNAGPDQNLANSGNSQSKSAESRATGAEETHSVPSDYDNTDTYTDADGTTWMLYHTPDGWVKMVKSARLG